MSDDDLTCLSYYQADDGTVIALAVPAEMGDGSGVIPPPTITFARGPVPKAEWTTFLYQGDTRPGAGLTFTELEADRNAALGRAPLHAEPIPCYEDDVSRCGCSTCISQPKIPGKRPDSKPPSQEPVRAPRPCCHTTGPNHHPACQESK